MVRCSTLTTFTLFIYSSYAPKYGKLIFNLFYFQKNITVKTRRRRKSGDINVN